MKFGENLKLIRKSKKISQEDLAEKLGVSRQSVSKWETGENYPSMINILCLCDIFKCKINELVHEDFVDINFLDEEIKMSVVKFKESEQKKMKGLSKLIYVFARIFKIFSIIGMIGSILMLIASFVIVPNIKFDTNKQKVKIFNEEYSYKLEDRKIVFDTTNKNSTEITYSYHEKKEVEKFVNKSTGYKISFIIVLGISLVLSCFFLFKLLSYVEKLFINIHDKDTPFSTENVNYIKKIALYLTLYVLIPDIFGFLVGLIFNIDLNVEINMVEYLFAVIILVISYIFKYGYEIQLGSNGKIYDNQNE